MRGFRISLTAVYLAISIPFLASGEELGRVIYDGSSIHHPVVGDSGMVVTQEAEATKVALQVLKDGGNAVDAAVTAGFALAVTLPRAGNIGGGGFMLVYEAESGKTLAYDFREMAPAATTKNLFLGKDGKPSRAKSPRSHFSMGVPGTVAGLLMALEKHGTLDRQRVVEPSVKLAREGFIVGPDLADSLETYKEELAYSPAARKVFFRKGGQPLRMGDRLIQTDLASSLERIAENGKSGFYEGETAAAIVRDMEQNRGLMTADDLKNYRTVVREPVKGTYRGYQIQTMSPPSAGGVIIIESLNMLEDFDLKQAGYGSASTIHLMAEATKRAFADRSSNMGDPAFVDVPVDTLVSKEFARMRAEGISTKRATPSSEISGALEERPAESIETTHFSVADRFGNVVVCTYTLNHSYGSRHMVPGTGILLNNELDDFVALAGVPDSFGLVSGDKNLPGPGKRPLSSMSPTIVFKDGKPWLLTGSPGGSHIPSTVLQMIVNTIDHGMNVAEATNRIN